MADPALSVQLVVRDTERWLPKTLESLRAQTRDDFEVVAVDDGSKDSTPALLEAARAHLPMRIFHTEGLGVVAARNIAIENARAPIVATLDGDDEWLPHYVETMVARLDSDRSIHIVSPEMLLAFDDTVVEDRYFRDGHPLRWFDDEQLENVLRMNFVSPMSAVRREVFDALGGYTPGTEAAEDWDFWIRAFAAGFRGGHDPEPRAIYRFRAGSLISSRTRLTSARVRVLEGAVVFLEGHARSVAQEALANQRLQYDIACGKEAMRNGDSGAARQAFLRVARSSQASARQRLGSLTAAAIPPLSRRILESRDSNAPKTALELRAARE